MLQAHHCAALPADTAGAWGEQAGDHVHLPKVLAVLLELCFGRDWFLFEFPCQPSPAQCFREESALQKSLKKKGSMLHSETIPLHHVQIGAIPIIQMGFGYFSL